MLQLVYCHFGFFLCLQQFSHNHNKMIDITIQARQHHKPQLCRLRTPCHNSKFPPLHVWSRDNLCFIFFFPPLETNPSRTWQLLVSCDVCILYSHPVHTRAFFLVLAASNSNYRERAGQCCLHAGQYFTVNHYCLSKVCDAGHGGYKNDSPMVHSAEWFCFTVLHKTAPNTIKGASAESVWAPNIIKEPINVHASLRS